MNARAPIRSLAKRTPTRSQALDFGPEATASTVRVLLIRCAGAASPCRTAVRPAAAFYHTQLKEFLLMYDDVRKTDSPRTMLMDFLQSTYEAAAILGDWNRKTLEREVEASL